jgi:hypothetical protein
MDKNNTIDPIDYVYCLYQSVFEEFRKGNFPVYRPEIFKNLTFEIFLDWIMENNPDFARLVLTESAQVGIRFDG